jgi:hypothetical protein
VYGCSGKLSMLLRGGEVDLEGGGRGRETAQGLLAKISALRGSLSESQKAPTFLTAISQLIDINIIILRNGRESLPYQMAQRRSPFAVLLREARIFNVLFFSSGNSRRDLLSCSSGISNHYRMFHE